MHIFYSSWSYLVIFLSLHQMLNFHESISCTKNKKLALLKQYCITIADCAEHNSSKKIVLKEKLYDKIGVSKKEYTLYVNPIIDIIHQYTKLHAMLPTVDYMSTHIAALIHRIKRHTGSHLEDMKKIIQFCNMGWKFEIPLAQNANKNTTMNDALASYLAQYIGQHWNQLFSTKDTENNSLPPATKLLLTCNNDLQEYIKKLLPNLYLKQYYADLAKKDLSDEILLRNAPFYFSADNKYIASLYNKHQLALYNNSEKNTHVFHTTGWYNDIVFSADGTHIAATAVEDENSASYKKVIYVWNIATKECRATIPLQTKWIYTLALSIDNNWIAYSIDHVYHQSMIVHHILTGATINNTADALATKIITFSPNKKQYASGLDNGSIKLWHIANGHNIATLQGHTKTIRSIDYIPDGTKLVSGSNDNTVRLWDSTTHACIGLFDTMKSPLQKVIFYPHSHYILAQTHDRLVHILDTSLRERTAVYKNKKAYVHIDHDGIKIINLCKDQSIQWLSLGLLPLASYNKHISIPDMIAFMNTHKSF